MQQDINTLSALPGAAGLTDGQRDELAQLVQVYERNKSKNSERLEYYEDTHRCTAATLDIPEEFQSSRLAVGWASKSVNMLADRSIIDRFTIAGDEPQEVTEAIDVDSLAYMYRLARRSTPLFGCGFWTLVKGTENPVDVGYKDLLSSAAVWDWRNKRVAFGFAIEDWSMVNDTMQPSVVVLYDPEATVQIEWDNGWSVTKADLNPTGQALMVAMPYKPTTSKPFGQSRISRPVMEITDEMQMEMANTMVHSRLFSSPQRYILGVDKNVIMSRPKLSLYFDKLFAISRDKNGEVPQVGEFAQASLEPHVSFMEHLARRMAEQTDLPVSAFGINTGGYTSSEGLRATTDDLIMAAEDMNMTNGHAVKSVVMLAVALHRGTTVKELPDTVKGLSVRFVDPSMPSLASRADAMVKKAAVMPWLAETRTALEDMGYDKATQDIILAEKSRAESRVAMNAIFGGSDAA